MTVERTTRRPENNLATIAKSVMLGSHEVLDLPRPDAPPGQSRKVSTSWPVSVTSTVCSHCAVRLRSWVTAVQSSSQTS